MQLVMGAVGAKVGSLLWPGLVAGIEGLTGASVGLAFGSVGEVKLVGPASGDDDALAPERRAIE